MLRINQQIPVQFPYSSILILPIKLHVTAASGSVYLLQDYGHCGSKDSKAQPDLPSSVTAYIDANSYEREAVTILITYLQHPSFTKKTAV